MTKEEKDYRLQAAVDIEKMGRVVFRAKNVKRQQKVVVTPLTDHTGNLYTGQGPHGYFELLTQKDREALDIGIVFDHDTKYTVENGKVLNLENPLDAARWKWIQLHPYIGMAEKDCNKGSEAVYYVDNPEKQAGERVSRDKIITKVKTYVYNATNDKAIAVAKAVGLNGAEGLKRDQIDDWLVIQCESHPQVVESLFDKSSADRVTALGLVKEMVTYNVLKQFGTVYKFGGQNGVTVGNSEDEAANFIMNTKNEDTVLSMQLQLDERKGLA